MIVSPRGFLRLLLKVSVLAAALLGAYLLRFDGMVPHDHLRQMLVALPVVVAADVAALHLSGVGRQSWQYTSARDVVEIAASLSAVSLVLLVVRVANGTVGGTGLGVLSLPLGVIGGQLVLALVGLFGLRMARRLQAEAADRRAFDADADTEHVLLIGAGRAGLLMARELERHPNLGLTPVGFLDDDPAKLGRRIGGVDVLGSVDEVGRIATAKDVRLAVITIAALDRREIEHILAQCKAAGVATKIVPGVYEIVGGNVSVSRIRDVDVADLLGRDPIELDDAPTVALVQGRTVLVTGAGGSIGSELARQVGRLRPSRLLLVERAEPALWAIHRELVVADPSVAVEPLVGDVQDQVRMAAIFRAWAPDVVIHAAAHKHVPMMEANPGEAVKNNVGGTTVVADLAAVHDVTRFVLVSTDKAVNPTSVMGATKRVAERYVQHVADSTGLHAVVVRFGNVLGSTGSVVPVFKEQVATGGPVTVTHPDMRRYFMTIPEASTLVLQAAAIGRPGEVLVLDMGEPVRIVDLAESVIRLSGLEPHVDVEVVFTGLRPGEKLFEELSLSAENATRTRHPKIWICPRPREGWLTAAADVRSLLGRPDSAEPDAVRSHLRLHVPEYRPEPVGPGGDVDDEPTVVAPALSGGAGQPPSTARTDDTT